MRGSLPAATRGISRPTRRLPFAACHQIPDLEPIHQLRQSKMLFQLRPLPALFDRFHRFTPLSSADHMCVIMSAKTGMPVGLPRRLSALTPTSAELLRWLAEAVKREGKRPGCLGVDTESAWPRMERILEGVVTARVSAVSATFRKLPQSFAVPAVGVSCSDEQKSCCPLLVAEREVFRGG